jgi:hypothetical protein
MQSEDTTDAQKDDSFICGVVEGMHQLRMWIYATQHILSDFIH